MTLVKEISIINKYTSCLTDVFSTQQYNRVLRMWSLARESMFSFALTQSLEKYQINLYVVIREFICSVRFKEVSGSLSCSYVHLEHFNGGYKILEHNYWERLFLSADFPHTHTHTSSLKGQELMQVTGPSIWERIRKNKTKTRFLSQKHE